MSAKEKKKATNVKWVCEGLDWLNLIGSFLLGASLIWIFGSFRGILLAISIVLIKEEIIERMS